MKKKLTIIGAILFIIVFTRIYCLNKELEHSSKELRELKREQKRIEKNLKYETNKN